MTQYNAGSSKQRTPPRASHVQDMIVATVVYACAILAGLAVTIIVYFLLGGGSSLIDELQWLWLVLVMMDLSALMTHL